MRRSAILLLTLTLFAGLASAPSVETGTAAVPVRFAEGTLHGFLELYASSGQLLAHGDLLQVPRDSDIESKLVFHFADSSIFRETVTFTQHGVFRLENYHLVQTGRAFAADLDATISRSGDYVVTSTDHKDQKAQKFTGKLDLPDDAYNGMIIVVGKNLVGRDAHTVHFVAFTPKPLLLPLELRPSGNESIPVGSGAHTETALRFTLKPKLSLLLKVGAALKGQTPPDSHLWIVTDDVPAFVRFEGPMYSGPVWRVDLTGPRWASAARAPSQQQK
jgi:hypothetical protein